MSRGRRAVAVVFLLVVLALAASCKTTPKSISDVMPDQPTDGINRVCPDASVPCVGTLSGDVMVGSFACTNPFANFNSTTGNTRFGINVAGAPPGTTSIDTTLGFVGMPGASATPTLQSSAVATVINLPTSTTWQATANPVAGTLTLSNITAVARIGGTPGDFCVHGSFTGTLPRSPGTGSVTLMFTF